MSEAVFARLPRFDLPAGNAGGSLNKAIETVRTDADRQAKTAIVAISEQLFPKLSRRFLASEIEAHLETMLPETAAHVEISANPALSEQLEDLLDQSTGLAGRCSVTPDEAARGARVDVSWKSGGLTFDFDGLLEACIGHLRTTHTAMGDKS